VTTPNLKCGNPISGIKYSKELTFLDKKREIKYQEITEKISRSKFNGKDFRTHKGNPSLLRSDSMLKAIGKAINIRVSSFSANKIPIIIIGNSPITFTYLNKVDDLKSAGVVQGFWSLNPYPSDTDDYIKNSPLQGFKTYNNIAEITKDCEKFVTNEYYFISTMLSKPQIGKCISIAAKEKTNTAKAEKFIELLKGEI